MYQLKNHANTRQCNKGYHPSGYARPVIPGYVQNASGQAVLTLSVAKVPQGLQTDRAIRHLLDDFARRAAREAGDELQ